MATTEVEKYIARLRTDRTRAIRAAIYDWLREDAPLSIKMLMMPEQVDKLEDRIEAACNSDPATRLT